MPALDERRRHCTQPFDIITYVHRDCCSLRWASSPSRLVVKRKRQRQRQHRLRSASSRPAVPANTPLSIHVCAPALVCRLHAGTARGSRGDQLQSRGCHGVMRGRGISLVVVVACGEMDKAGRALCLWHHITYSPRGRGRSWNLRLEKKILCLLCFGSRSWVSLWYKGNVSVA